MTARLAIKRADKLLAAIKPANASNVHLLSDEQRKRYDRYFATVTAIAELSNPTEAYEFTFNNGLDADIVKALAGGAYISADISPGEAQQIYTDFFFGCDDCRLSRTGHQIELTLSQRQSSRYCRN